MHELTFQAGVKGMSERSELIPCIYYEHPFLPTFNFNDHFLIVNFLNTVIARAHSG